MFAPSLRPQAVWPWVLQPNTSSSIVDGLASDLDPSAAAGPRTAGGSSGPQPMLEISMPLSGGEAVRLLLLRIRAAALGNNSLLLLNRHMLLLPRLLLLLPRLLLLLLLLLLPRLLLLLLLPRLLLLLLRRRRCPRCCALTVKRSALTYSPVVYVAIIDYYQWQWLQSPHGCWSSHSARTGRHRGSCRRPAVPATRAPAAGGVRKCRARWGVTRVGCGGGPVMRG